MKVARLTHTKHFRVTPALHEMLSDIAAKSNRHESDLIRVAVSAFAQHYASRPQELEQLA
jgi:predicted transcriptional regulator